MESMERRIDTMSMKYTCRIILYILCITLVLTIIHKSILPNILEREKGYEVCPNNEKSVRIQPYCREFNLRENDFYYMYTRSMNLRSHSITIQSTFQPLTPQYIDASYRYSVVVTHVDSNYRPIDKSVRYEYLEASVKCSTNSPTCETNILYTDVSLEDGIHLVQIYLLDLIEIRETYKEVYIDIKYIDPYVYTYIDVVRGLLMVYSICILASYYTRIVPRGTRVSMVVCVCFAYSLSCVPMIAVSACLSFPFVYNITVQTYLFFLFVSNLHLIHTFHASYDHLHRRTKLYSFTQVGILSSVYVFGSVVSYSVVRRYTKMHTYRYNIDNTDPLAFFPTSRVHSTR